MTATNHTNNYNLSQFVGTDRPTWLGDYNSDMKKIDAQLKQNADDIKSAAAGGLTSVNHTADLTGNGTSGSPLGIAATIARKTDTISYEVLCGVSRRVPRVYLENGGVKAVEDWIL